MAETSRFALPLIAADQAQKHVTHNAALEWLEPFAAGLAASATTASPPATPAEGEIHLVPAAGWSGVAAAHQVAQWRAGAWAAIDPAVGWRFRVADEGVERTFAGAGVGWIPASAFGAVTGAGLALRVFDALLTLSGASTAAAALIPPRAIVLGVTSWTVEEVTGAPSYSCGKAPGGSDFGAALGVAAGSSNIGVVGPYATYAPEDVVISADGGGPFTAGVVGVAASVIAPAGAPL